MACLSAASASSRFCRRLASCVFFCRECVDGWMGAWVDGWKGGRTNVSTAHITHIHTNTHNRASDPPTYLAALERGGLAVEDEDGLHPRRQHPDRAVEHALWVWDAAGGVTHTGQTRQLARTSHRQHTHTQATTHRPTHLNVARHLPRLVGQLGGGRPLPAAADGDLLSW